MRRLLRAWRIWAAAGLMLFVISACASSPSTAPTRADDQSAGQNADMSGEEALARQQASEEKLLMEEAARRQFEIERNRFVYEDIFFAKNKYRLTDQAVRELSWKADWLMTYPDIQVMIEGYCDEGGGAEANLALGARRAGEVESFFLRRGIPRERLTVISYGKERPIATGDTEEARAKNRRVRTQIIGD